MSTSTRINTPETSDLLILAEQEIAEAAPELAGAYRKATRALLRYFPQGRLRFTDFDSRSLRDWVVAMLCSNCSLQTVLYYLENVAAIYNKAVKLGRAPKTDAFRILKAELLATHGDSLTRNVKETLTPLSRLAKGRVKLVGDMEYYADLLLFSFYTGGLSIPAILNLETAILPDLVPEALVIAEKYRDKRRSRIFPRGAAATVEQRTKMIAHHVGLDTPPDMTVGQITARLWVLAALRLGIPAGTIASCHLPEDADLAMLSFAKTDAKPLHPEEIYGIYSQVARSVVDNPLNWHVMKLRAHHTYEEVTGRLNGNKFKHIEYFYPQEEISRRIGKKLEFDRRPVLPYVIFFRSKDTDIAPMFKNIGDLAWCYRYTLGGPYATISRAEMDRFQRTIGTFTPDFDLRPLGTTPLGIGRMVRVTGGPMAGYEGEIFSLEDTSPSARSASSPSASKTSPSAEGGGAQPRLFRLRIFGENGIEWKITIDERQLEPLN